MPELLTVEVIFEMLRELGAAHWQKQPDSKVLAFKAEAYRRGLQGVSGEALRWAVKTSIQEDEFFPKVSRLRELAARWSVANTAAVAARDDGRTCASCRSPFEWIHRWRPTVDDRGRVQLSADGQWLLLERYSRSICTRCERPCEYRPEDGAPMDGPAMRLFNDKGGANVPLHIIRALADQGRKLVLASESVRGAA